MDVPLSLYQQLRNKSLMRSGRINLEHVSIIMLFSLPYVASSPFCLRKGDKQDTVHCVLLDERHVRLNLVHFKTSTELISVQSEPVWNAKQPRVCAED